MYTLTLKQYRIDVFLGVDECERQKKQSVFCDIFIYFEDRPLACTSDNLSDTICYDELLKIISNSVGDQQFKLIEKLAKFIFDIIKTNVKYKHKLSVTIYKPNPRQKLGCAVFTVSD